MVSRTIEFFRQWIHIISGKEMYRDAIYDPRLDLEKSKDFIFGEDVELASGTTGKRITKLSFEPYDQQRTSACGAFAASHVRLLSEKAKNFPPAWYRTRSNYSGEGMFVHDVLKLMAHASEVDEPKNIPKVLRENYVNELELVDVFSNDRAEKKEYVKINPYDSDAVLKAVSNGYPTLISFFSTYDEWREEMEVRSFTTPLTASVRHFVVALPNSLHEKDGKMWVSVVDSARQGGLCLRHLSLDFLKQRMFLGGGFTYDVDTKPKKVKVIPATRCQYGQRNDNVLALQEYMLAHGLMDKKHMTGYYGRITARAVLTWQLDNIKDVSPVLLQQWNGHYWGPASIKAALINTI